VTSCGADLADHPGGPDGSSVSVSKADFGKDWPLTVDSGTLHCEGAGTVTFASGGTTYAVNGFAIGEHKYADIQAIWAKDPSGMVPRKDIGPLIQHGLKLCPNHSSRRRLPIHLVESTEDERPAEPVMLEILQQF
jgi:hypothetical protein